MTPTKYFNALIEKSNTVPFNTVNAYYWTHFNDVSHPPVYLSMAEIWSAWASRQSQFLVVSVRPHWAQWNSGYNGRSHRALPSVPSTAMKNTHGDGRPGKKQRMLNIKTHTLLVLLNHMSYLLQYTCCSDCLSNFWEQRGHLSPCPCSRLQ